jgi:bifunctional UDP-N-acetylglucosamine pyrophosphorylase/glucosamine-1-phosphate N-acetyltransferase
MKSRSGAIPVSALVLAAGQGKRMKSDRVKLLHELGGAPMVCHVARAAAHLEPATLAAVVGNQGAQVTAALSGEPGLIEAGLCFVTQQRQLGTAHAVLQAEPLLRRAGKFKGDLLILNGDVPLIRPSTLRALLRHHRRQRAAATVLTTLVDDPAGYGRVVRDDEGELVSIVEDRDASAHQKKIREINAGLYCADLSLLFSALKRTGRSNAQGEYYLPDLFPILRSQGRRIAAYLHADAEEVLGVNDRAELARAGRVLYRRRAAELMASGVTIVDPDCTYIDPGVRVGRDTIIHPLARIEGRSRIGSGCVIGSLSHIADTTLADNVLVRDMCVISDSTISTGAKIGPFAHIRPGTVLGQDVHVGNFVEVKKSRVGRGSKANHLTYLGDAVIGEGCNVGAGTITCNYDGVHKHTTTLEDRVFIGSNSALVAPVKIGRGAYVGAGSVITRDVPAGALGLTRAPQRIIEDWAERRRRELETPPKRQRRRKRGKA